MNNVGNKTGSVVLSEA